jgi:hypothetical protein
MSSLVRVVSPLVLLIVLGAVATVTAFGQGGLQFFIPRQVEKPPSSSNDRVAPPLADGWNKEDFGKVEQAAGFKLLAPTYLPPGCGLGYSLYDATVKEAKLGYSCVSIAQKRGERVERPWVGPNSIQEITIAGRPAILVDGSWVRMAPDKDPEWRPGFVPMLAFERTGIVVRMLYLGDNKTELIRIAESMR